MKTIYIPKGETVAYESVVTENLIIEGCLNVTYGVKARRIAGDGIIHAGTIAADTIRASDVECASIMCEKLLARRVSAAEVFASDSAAVSCFLSAAYVETGRLTVGISEIDEVKADQVVNLKPKKRGLLRLLLASALRAFWLSLLTPATRAEQAEASEPGPDTVKPENEAEAALREKISKRVREVLAEQRGPDDAANPDSNDFELQRIVSLFKLARESGYTLRLVPGTPEENAPVFDFDAGEIIKPAA